MASRKPGNYRAWQKFLPLFPSPFEGSPSGAFGSTINYEKFLMGILLTLNLELFEAEGQGEG